MNLKDIKVGMRVRYRPNDGDDPITGRVIAIRSSRLDPIKVVPEDCFEFIALSDVIEEVEPELDP